MNSTIEITPNKQKVQPLGKIVILGNIHTSTVTGKIRKDLKKLSDDRLLILLDEKIDNSCDHITNDFYRQLDHPQVKLLGTIIAGIRGLDILTKKNYLSSRISEHGIDKSVIFMLNNLVVAFRELHFYYSNTNDSLVTSIEVLSNCKFTEVNKRVIQLSAALNILYEDIKSYSTTQNTPLTEFNIHFFTNKIDILRYLRNDLHSLFVLFAKILSLN